MDIKDVKNLRATMAAEKEFRKCIVKSIDLNIEDMKPDLEKMLEGYEYNKAKIDEVCFPPNNRVVEKLNKNEDILDQTKKISVKLVILNFGVIKGKEVFNYNMKEDSAKFEKDYAEYEKAKEDGSEIEEPKKPLAGKMRTLDIIPANIQETLAGINKLGASLQGSFFVYGSPTDPETIMCSRFPMIKINGGRTVNLHVDLETDLRYFVGLQIIEPKIEKTKEGE